MMDAGSETFQFVACEGCGLVFLNPRVEPESLGQYYGASYLPYRGPQAWGRYAPLVERDARRTDLARVRLVQRYAQPTADTRVLDVGCGRPSFLDRLHRATQAKGIGLDFSDEGWRDDPAAWAHLQLITGDPALVRLPDQLDLITMWHYLEHDYDPGQTLRKLASHAAPQARLLIEVPNLDAWPRHWQGAHWAGFHTPRHTALYTPATLRDLLERHGWEVVHQHEHGTLDPYALFWMGRMERRGLDWESDMERQFWGFMRGKVLTWPLFALQRWLPLGAMTAIARPKGATAHNLPTD
jgi:SAM-dependent methyltransferase